MGDLDPQIDFWLSYSQLLEEDAWICTALWTVKKAEHRRLMLLNCGVGEDSWESLGLQGDQPWVFFGRNDAKAETSVLWPPHVKRWLIGKDSEAGRDWGQKEKGTTEDEMTGCHRRLDGHEFEWTPGVGDGQGGLAWCNSWGRKESDTTERLIWSDLKEVKDLYSKNFKTLMKEIEDNTNRWKTFNVHWL